MTHFKIHDAENTKKINHERNVKQVTAKHATVTVSRVPQFSVARLLETS
jgi:hypothetical protein